MINIIVIFFGKLLSFIAKKLNLGHGSTWPGHVALRLNKHFIRNILKKSNTKIIIVAGTNGKTTTAKLIAHILEQNGKRILQNESGANLLNGIASTLLLHSTVISSLSYDYAIFEVDENTLTQVLNEITPDYLVVLNLFRDQLDRYGEINTIAAKWQKTITRLPERTTLILNADDPQIAYLGEITDAKSLYYSIKPEQQPTLSDSHAVDSIYCPRCGHKLTFHSITFSHLGNWHCTQCGLKRPQPHLTHLTNYPLFGRYNQYNTNAAVLLTETLRVNKTDIQKALTSFSPAFGRQEELIVDGKKIRIFLSKNPTGFNESLRTSKELGAKHILFVLNDRIPDGRDVSWIWDTDIENILDGREKVFISGDRANDMAIRIKYAAKMENFNVYEQLDKAIKESLDELDDNETLYILPTYSAMLDIRKIITGKKIL